MKSMVFSRRSGRLFPGLFIPFMLLMILLMLASLVLAPSAQARRYLSNGGGDGSSEGDPLDANDFGSGGGGLIDGDIQDSSSYVDPGDGGAVIQLPARDAVYYLVVDFRGSIPVLRIIKMASPASLVEGPDAR